MCILLVLCKMCGCRVIVPCIILWPMYEDTGKHQTVWKCTDVVLRISTWSRFGKADNLSVHCTPFVNGKWRIVFFLVCAYAHCSDTWSNFVGRCMVAKKVPKNQHPQRPICRAVQKWSDKTPGAISLVLVNFHQSLSVPSFPTCVPINCPWVSEDDKLTITDIVDSKGGDMKNKFVGSEVLWILAFVKLFQHLRFWLVPSPSVKKHEEF